MSNLNKNIFAFAALFCMVALIRFFTIKFCPISHCEMEIIKGFGYSLNDLFTMVLPFTLSYDLIKKVGSYARARSL